MKKYIYLGIGLITTLHIQAQSIDEALKISQDNTIGTARFRSMSGAFGALGGDLSAINVNPAGSTVFNNNQVGVTLSSSSNRNKTNYFNSLNESTQTNLRFNQLGGVFVFKDDSESNPWKKIALGINYETTNRHNNYALVAGTNPNNSMANYFVQAANGIPLNVIRELGVNEDLSDVYRYLGTEYGHNEQIGFLGVNGNIIKPINDNDNNTDYFSNAGSNNFYQEKETVSSGFTSKTSFNFAAEFKKVASFGINLNHHYTEYYRTFNYFERGSSSQADRLSTLSYENTLLTLGNGFSFQLGTIIKLKDLRLGLTYDSPVWHRFTDEQTEGVSTTVNGSNGRVDIYPNITNFYLPYKLRSPGKSTFSMAYIFGKKGLISVDYGIKCYTQTRYSPTNEFTNVNLGFENAMQLASDFRIGAEYRIKNVSLRGGYRYQESPYKKEFTNMGDLKGYSAGIGYVYGPYRFDLAYSYSKRKYQETMFDKGLLDTYKTDHILQNISFTVIFDL